MRNASTNTGDQTRLTKEYLNELHELMRSFPPLVIEIWFVDEPSKHYELMRLTGAPVIEPGSNVFKTPGRIKVYNYHTPDLWNDFKLLNEYDWQYIKARSFLFFKDQGIWAYYTDGTIERLEL